MNRLNSIKDKLTWSHIVAVLVYVGAAAIRFAVLLPGRNQAKELEGKIQVLEREEQRLSQIVAGKPALESKIEEIRERLVTLEQDIPSQYDLPGVQDVLRRLSVYYDLEVVSSDHIPLQANQTSDHGVIPLSLRLKGDETLLSYVAHIQESLPTLSFNDLVLTYLGGRQFDLSLQADLHVLVLGHASLSNWESPSLDPREKVSLPTSSFGISFETIKKFLEQRVRVLGVVEAGKESTVLLSKDGVRRWYRLGDRLDEARVSSIFSNGVVLDVDGVHLKLTVGS